MDVGDIIILAYMQMFSILWNLSEKTLISVIVQTLFPGELLKFATILTSVHSFLTKT
jgi:hypothetical protein